MISGAVVSHNSMGRLRLKIPSRKKDSNYFFSVREKLLSFKGVSSVDVNPITGSVLILHSLEESNIIEFASSENLFSLDIIPQKDSNFHNDVSTSFDDFNEKVKEYSSGAINLGGLFTVSLFGVGLYQMFRGKFEMMSWYTALWYAYNVFLKTKE